MTLLATAAFSSAFSRTLAVAALTAAPALSQVLYDVTDLGPVPGAGPLSGVIAKGISADGSKVVGTSVWEGYVWDDVTGMRALAKPAGEAVLSAESVVSTGAAVGYSGLTSSSYRAQFWDPAGAVQSLHQPGWVWSRALAIDENGRVLVTAGIPFGSSTVAHAFLGTPMGGFVDLAPAASSASGLVLTNSGYTLFADSNAYMLLDPLGGTSNLGSAYTVHAVSESGEAGGIANGRAARWTPALGWQELPQGGLNIRQFGGVDSFGRVGASHAVQTGISPPRFDYFAHLHIDGLGWIDLNAHVDPTQFLDVETIAGITDNGRIAAFGSIGPDNRALLLEPRYVSHEGTGCGGARGAPKVTAAGTPIGGHRLAFLGGNAPAGEPGVILVSLLRANVPLFGCTALVDPFTPASFAVTAGAGGHVSVPVDLPATASGLTLFAQYITRDPGAANGFLSMSNRVAVDVQ